LIVLKICPIYFSVSDSDIRIEGPSSEYKDGICHNNYKACKIFQGHKEATAAPYERASFPWRK
jgi:hypothetical protein